MNSASAPEEHGSHFPPSANDQRELVEQLRSAPAEEIVAEVFFMLLNAAQVKLGRRDARLLIDLTAVMLDHAGSYVSDTLVKQLEQSLGQLRLAQVSAESELAKKEHPEPNDLASTPAPPQLKR